MEFNILAGVLIRKGDLSAAEPNIQQAKEGFRAIGDPRGVAVDTSLMAEVLYAEGDLAAAEKAGIEAFGMLRNEVDRDFKASVLATLGKIRKAQGRLEEAKKEHEQSEDIRRTIGTPEPDATSKLYLADIAIEERRFEDAAQLAREAESIFQKTKAPYLEGYAQALVAESLAGEGKLPEAREKAKAVLARSKTFMQFDYRLAVQILGARILTASTHYADQGDLAEATAVLNEALADARSHGYLTHQFDARLALGEIHLRSGNVAEGRKELAILERDARAKGFMLVARKAAITKGSS